MIPHLPLTTQSHHPRSITRDLKNRLPFYEHVIRLIRLHSKATVSVRFCEIVDNIHLTNYNPTNTGKSEYWSHAGNCFPAKRMKMAETKIRISCFFIRIIILEREIKSEAQTFRTYCVAWKVELVSVFVLDIVRVDKLFLPSWSIDFPNANRSCNFGGNPCGGSEAVVCFLQMVIIQSSAL